MNDLVSIVIPVFNAEKYLEESINSCLNQTYSNIEIIAINDGSTDNTPEILDSFSDRISVISQENKGIAGAINTGIHHMKSNWYKLMNADDLLYPDCVETLISEVDKLDNKKIIPYGCYDIIDSKGKFTLEHIPNNPNGLNTFEQGVTLLDYQDINCITTIIHKDTFSTCGYYNESVKFSEDYEFLLRLSLLHGFRFHLIEKTLAKYRHHEKQDSLKLKKIAPNYANETRESILDRLAPIQHQKYEIALIQYKKKFPITGRAKNRVNNFVSKVLSPSSAKKVSKLYRKVTGKQPSKYHYD